MMMSDHLLRRVLAWSSATVVTTATAGFHYLASPRRTAVHSLIFRYFQLPGANQSRDLNNMGTRLTKFRSDSYDIQGQHFQEGRASLCTMTSKDDATVIEKVVCNVDDLEDNQMKEFTIEKDKKILLIKDKGNFTAVGTKCTHYGAPLVNGVYCNGVIRCPWHGACFNSTTGDIEDFPGLDSLPLFDVQIEGNKVKVQAKKSALQSAKHEKEMAKRDPSDATAFIIIGAGAAGAKCAETLRQIGYEGRIVLVTKESHLPYDRPKLSKAPDMAVDKIALRSYNFYAGHDIELIKNKEVTSLNTKDKLITLNDGTTIVYTKMLIATGGIPRKLTDLPGCDLQNIVVLRSVDDANFLANQIKGRHVVILGMSFIGMESAAYFAGKAASVSVIGSTSVPFLPVLGEEIGTRLKKLFEEKGVVFHCNESIAEFKGENDKLKEVVLGNGTKLPADICLLGIGVEPSTKFVRGSGIDLLSSGHISVDKHMKSNIDDIYAAGDIVQFPLFCSDDKQVNVQHWQMAHYHGHIAALNMMNKPTPVHSVPFFWTSFFGLNMRYAGFGAGFEDVIIQGNLETLEFVAYYLKDDIAIAISSMKRDPIASQFAEVLRTDKTITKNEIENNEWLQKLII